MFHYCAYNLSIASDVPLPELPCTEKGSDVEIRLRRPQVLNGKRAIQWEVAPLMACFHFPGAGRFVVRDGGRVWVTPDPPGDPPLLRLYIQGMMLAALLYQRGLFVLHASVMQMGDRAVAFLGPVGAGKSTLAAALHARGYAVVADDNAAIRFQDGSPFVLPAFPNLKVYPAIAEALGYDPAALQLMHGSQRKRAQRVEGFASAPLRLDRIYVLDRQAEPQAVRLAPVDAITELVRHSVPTRWGVAGDGAHLAMCGRLAADIPLFRVRTFATLGEIAGIAGRIEDHGAEFAAASCSAI